MFSLPGDMDLGCPSVPDTMKQYHLEHYLRKRFFGIFVPRVSLLDCSVFAYQFAQPVSCVSLLPAGHTRTPPTLDLPSVLMFASLMGKWCGISFKLAFLEINTCSRVFHLFCVDFCVHCLIFCYVLQIRSFLFLMMCVVLAMSGKFFMVSRKYSPTFFSLLYFSASLWYEVEIQLCFSVWCNQLFKYVVVFVVVVVSVWKYVLAYHLKE